MQARRISGVVEPPPSFREFSRAAFLSLFASGETVFENPPRCQGTEELSAFLSRFFNAVRREGDSIIVKGAGGFSGPGLPLEIQAADHHDFLEGLAPLFFNRGVKMTGLKNGLTPRFREALKLLDAAGFSLQLSEPEGAYELEILKSSPDGAEIELEKGDEAVKTACLFALVSAATGASRVVEALPSPSSAESLIRAFGVNLTAHRKGDPAGENGEDEVEMDELERRIRRIQGRREKSGERPLRVIHVEQGGGLKACRVRLRGDALLAAPFMLSALLIRDSSLIVRDASALELNGLVTVFKRMGGEIDNKGGELAAKSSKLTGRRVSGELTASLNDLFPFAAVAAAFAEGQTVIRDGAYLRDGPVDLIDCTLKNLKAMGVKAGEIDDGLVIEGAKEYDGAELDCFGEPSLCLALCAAAAKNRGGSVIKNAEAVDRLWPDFFFQFEKSMEKME